MADIPLETVLATPLLAAALLVIAILLHARNKLLRDIEILEKLRDPDLGLDRYRVAEKFVLRAIQITFRAMYGWWAIAPGFLLGAGTVFAGFSVLTFGVLYVNSPWFLWVAVVFLMVAVVLWWWGLSSLNEDMQSKLTDLLEWDPGEEE